VFLCICSILKLEEPNWFKNFLNQRIVSHSTNDPIIPFQEYFDVWFIIVVHFFELCSIFESIGDLLIAFLLCKKYSISVNTCCQLTFTKPLAAATAGYCNR
jgi:hypothetical protein